MKYAFIHTIFLSTLLNSYAIGATGQEHQDFNEKSPLLSLQHTFQTQENLEKLPITPPTSIVLSPENLELKKHHYNQACANLNTKNFQNITFKNNDLIEKTIDSLNIAARLGSASSKRILIHLLAQDSLPLGTPFITQYSNNSLPKPMPQEWETQIKSLGEKENKYMLYSNYLLSKSGCGLVYDLLISKLQDNNSQELRKFKEVFKKQTDAEFIFLGTVNAFGSFSTEYNLEKINDTFTKKDRILDFIDSILQISIAVDGTPILISKVEKSTTTSCTIL